MDADCVIPDPDRFFTRALLQFRKNPNLVALAAYLETFGDRLIQGVANLGLRLENNVLSREVGSPPGQSDAEGCGCAQNPQAGSRINARCSFT
jgi:hypothetical protein